MKTLLTGMAIATAMLSSSPPQLERSNAELNMHVLSDDAFKAKVKIFDYKGNLIKEMRSDDVANEDISINDYFLLEGSDYAFTYLGDYYYLRD